MRKYTLNFLLFILCIAVIFSPEANAQRNIINVPTSDILPKGDIILRLSNRFRPFEPEPFVTLSPSVALGVGKDTEVVVGVITRIDDEDTAVRADLSVKKVFFLNGTSRLVLGTRINPFLSEKSAPDSFTYTEISRRIVKTRTQLVSGVYVAGRREALPDRVGAMVGMEQAILSNKVRLAVDWISGDESYAMLGAGIKYRITPTLTVTSAVSIPNNKERDNMSFILSFSKLIQLK